MVSNLSAHGWFHAGLREVFVRNEAARFPGLDGLRALAILLVICFHGFFFTQYAFQEHHSFQSLSSRFPAC